MTKRAGKKIKASTATAAAAASASVPAEARGKFDWTAKSNVPSKSLQLLEKEGQIPAGQWRKPGDEVIPKPTKGERVVFADHVKRGLSLPLHAFVRGLLYVYGLQVHDLPPNAVMQICCFIVLCECFLGIHPCWALWKRLFYVKSASSRVAYCTGGFLIQSRPNVAYFNMKFCDSVQGWRRRWFYLKDSSREGQQFGLAPFNPDAVIAKRRSWRHELSDEEMEATEGLMAQVAELASHESFGTHLVSLFIKRRVQPLQARVAPMWEYSGPSDPTRTREEELSKDEFEARLVAVTNLKLEKDMPGESPVTPFGQGRTPKQVTFLRFFVSQVNCFYL